MDTELLIKKEADNFRCILEYDFKPDYHLKVKNELESKLYNYDENVDKLIFCKNTTFFRMPIELKIVFADGSNEIIKSNNTYNLQMFTFEFDKEPVRISFDPNDQIVLKEVIR